MPTIAERLETATTQLEAQVAPLSAAVTTCTTKATEASASATAAAGSAATATTKAADAETARAAAVVAKDAAETAETNAETAETNAETAAAASETARAAAVVAKDAALAAQTAAETAETNAETAETNAETAATTATTQAGTATTKATEAAASAAAALTSQNAAAASAATAAGIAGFTAFKGTQAGASVPATSTNSGDAYLITSAGTSQSKTWAVNDLAIYNGTSGSWTQVAAAVWMGLSVPLVATRRTHDHLNFDGSISGVRGYWPLGTAGNGIGAGKLTGLIRAFIPGSTVSNSRGLWYLGDLNNGHSGSNYYFHLYFSAENLVLGISSGDLTNRRYLTYTNARATYGGDWRAIGVTWDGASAPILYVDGAALTANSELTNGSNPPWSTAVEDDFLVMGIFSASDRWDGPIEPPVLVNGVLSAAEMLYWAKTGKLPRWCQVIAGSMVPVYTSNFSAGVDSWDQNISDVNLTRTGNVDGVSGVDDTLQFQAVGANKSFQVKRPSVSGMTKEMKYRLTFDYFAEAGSTSGTPHFGAGVSGTRTDDVGIPVVEGSWQTGKYLDFISRANANQIDLSMFTTAAGSTLTSLLSGKSIWFKNMTLIPLSPMFTAVVQPIPVAMDTGSNKLPGIFTAGVTFNTDKRDWVIQGKTSTSGNQQLLGASVFLDYLKHMLDTIETNGASTATVSVGSASGGAQYKASAAIASGRNRHSLVTPIPGTNNIWVTSSTTDELTHTIRGHLVD